jgi:hypothetical protein
MHGLAHVGPTFVPSVGILRVGNSIHFSQLDEAIGKLYSED